MKKLSQKDRDLLDSVVQKHAPWINMAIKDLKGRNKLPQQFDDNEFYAPGHNALIEALSSYDKSKGSFFSYAQNLIKHRLMGHVESEMLRGGGGVDPYFLAQERAAKAKARSEVDKPTNISIDKPVEPPPLPVSEPPPTPKEKPIT